MYILTTLEFPTHNFDFHLLTTSVNAKYYDYLNSCMQCNAVLTNYNVVLKVVVNRIFYKLTYLSKK